MANVVYKEATANRLCCRLSEELKNRIKDEQFERYLFDDFSFEQNPRIHFIILNRYKLVCNVAMGQRGAQKLQMYDRFLWDSEWDNYAYYKYETRNYYAVATVYACYYD